MSNQQQKDNVQAYLQSNMFVYYDQVVTTL